MSYIFQIGIYKPTDVECRFWVREQKQLGVIDPELVKHTVSKNFGKASMSKI